MAEPHLEDGTPVVCLGGMPGVPAGTPAVVRHLSPSGYCHLPRLVWLELEDVIHWSHGNSESKGYWAGRGEYELAPPEPTS